MKCQCWSLQLQRFRLVWDFAKAILLHCHFLTLNLTLDAVAVKLPNEVQLLLENKAAIDHRDKWGQTPLFRAVQAVSDEQVPPQARGLRGSV